MNEPARFDDQGSWQPDDEANAMRGIAVGLCLGCCFWIAIGGILWGVLA